MTLRHAIAEGEAVGAGCVLVPPRKALTGTGGASITRRAGGSLEFRDHRDYEPGDDLRHLDWSVFARSDRLAVKQFHEEISPFVDIVLDGSRSMALGGPKAEAAVAIAAMLAAAASNSGFPYALSIARSRLDIMSRGTTRPTAWDEIAFDHAGSPAEAVTSGARTLRPMGMRFFISDLLWSGEPQTVAASLAHAATDLTIVQILAREDAAPTARGGTRIVDVESGEWREVFVDAEAIERYRDALARHRALWDETARQTRATIVRCIAEEVAGRWIFDDLVAAEVLRPAWSRS
jgi:uncharacterized protein (DUF58 family)